MLGAKGAGTGVERCRPRRKVPDGVGSVVVCERDLEAQVGYCEDEEGRTLLIEGRA